MRSKLWWGCDCSLAVLTLSAPAYAQTRMFEIPAQDLSSAVTRFGHQAHLQIIAPSEPAQHKRSNAIHGKMDAREALARMIAGTGVSVAKDSGSTIILRDQPVAVPASPAPGTPNDETKVEPAQAEIVVSGTHPIGESEAAALAVQKASNSLVTVLSSDSVGRMPDQNMASALGRIPGMAIQRDQGRARYLELRGAPANWTTVSFDGINIISPDGRQTLFDTIPSAIASQIIVRKAVTPDMTGETIAGNVDIVTRTGFDFPGPHITGKIGGGINDEHGKGEYEAALVASDRFNTGIGEIGVVVSGTYYHRAFDVNNFEGTWENEENDQRSGYGDRIWNAQTTNKNYRLTNTNYSATARVDWKISPDNRVFLSSVYTGLQETEARNKYTFGLNDQSSLLSSSSAACTISATPAAGTTGYADVCTGNTPSKGTDYGVALSTALSYKDFLQSISTNTIGGDHKLGDWKLTWRGNYTRALNDRSIPFSMSWATASYGTNGAGAVNRPTVDYDFSDPDLAKLTLYQTVRNADGTFSKGAQITAIEDIPVAIKQFQALKALDITNAYTGKFGLSRDFSLFGHHSTFTVGGQFDSRVKTDNESTLTLKSAAQFAAAGIDTTYTSILGSTTPNSLPDGYSSRYFSIDQALDDVKKAEAVGTWVPTTANHYRVLERALAGYAMLQTDFSWGNIIAGTRVENVLDRGTAIANLTGGSTNVTEGSSRTLLFPSLHVNVNLDDTKKLRFSFNTGAARPDYSILRPNYTVNDLTQVISGGNPKAKPERAKGVDLYFEWYTRPHGLISAGVFYKWLNDVLFDATGIFNDTSLNTSTVDRSLYTYSTTLNGGSGYLYGFEGDVQQQLEPFTSSLGLPDWVGGFGVQANVTLNGSRTTAPDGRRVRLPGTSDVVYNAGVYYERSRASLRLNYQYRSKYIDSVSSPVSGGDIYFAPDKQLDFSSRYAFTDNFEVYFDVANILNTPLRRYAGDPSRTIEFARFGQRFTGGIRFKL